jgi:ABC-2 type transport system permease protein
MFIQSRTAICDVLTVVHKELREVMAAAGLSALSTLMLACGLGIASGLLVHWLGFAWLDRPLLPLLWLLLPIPLVIVAVAESFAGERERHTLETLLATRLSTQAILQGKIIAATLFGWLASVVVLATGALTLHLFQADPIAQPVDLGAVAAIVGLGFLVALFTACIGALISQNAANVRQARAQHSIVVILILLGVSLLMALFAQVLPDLVHLSAIVPLTAATVLLVADLALYIAAAVRYSRSRLLTC